MKYILLCFVLVFLNMGVYAQGNIKTGKGKITGKIKDAATNAPVEYAAISIMKQGSTQPVNGTTSDTKGAFVLNNIPEGEYQLAIDFIGYKRTTVDHIMINAATTSVILNNINMASSQKMLKDVNVTAKANTIENKIDKLVYNAANDLTAQGGVATDILKKVPMVTVDIDGNVELLGNPSVKFLINGKPSSIFGASLTDALQSIPASQIKSVEVITSPGARYDASGTGGIINIILKDNKVEGYNASINASAGTRNENTSVNLNVRKSNFGVSAFFGGNATLRSKGYSTRTRISVNKDTTINQFQSAYGDFVRNGFQTGVNIDYNLNKHDNLSAGISYHHFFNQNEGVTNQEDQGIKTGFAPYSDILSIRNSNSQSGSGSIDVHADYKKTFKKEGQELGIGYSGSFNNSHGDLFQKLDYLKVKRASAGQTAGNPGKDEEHELTVDYAHPFGEDFVIETGAKAYFETINSTSIINPYDTVAKAFMYSPTQSSNFNYSRNVYSYYASASFKLFDFFDVKAGLRDEYTTTSVNFQAGNIPSYNFLSPSFVLQHKTGKTTSVKISYSKRIERPDFGDINPFVNNSDPYNISYGNPNLHPEIGNNFEVGFNHSYDGGGNINITAFYRHNGFDVKQYTFIADSLLESGKYYKNVFVTTRANVGAEVRAGVNFSASLPITKNLMVRPNFLVAQRRIMVNLAGTPPFVSGYDYRLNINASYQFPHDLAAEAFMNYDGPRVGLQGRNSAFVAYNFAMRKQLWNKKASVGLTANVPFADYVNQSQTITTPDSYQYSLRQVPFRSFGISFSYKFGKLEFKEDKNKDNNNPPPNIDQ